MNQLSVAIQARTGDYESASRQTLWLQAGLLGLLVGLLYYPILVRLVSNWWDDPNFSHGFFVPAFSGFVIWHDRKYRASLPLNPCWSGLAIIAIALGTLIAGVLGAELFLSRSSLVLLLAGLAIYSMGWGYFRSLIFPWACLFLMIPIPAIIFNQIAFPLQFLASQFAGSLLTFLGVPMLREGNVIHLPAMSLEVAQACSGVRSLVSLVTLAIIYGYFLEPRVLKRVLLAIAAIPIAILANSLRIAGTGVLVQYWDPRKAEGFFHTFAGWMIFVLSLGMLFGLHGLMTSANRWWRRGTA